MVAPSSLGGDVGERAFQSQNQIYQLLYGDGIRGVERMPQKAAVQAVRRCAMRSLVMPLLREKFESLPKDFWLVLNGDAC